MNVSRRMHPAVCSFISDAIYDGRLVAHPNTEARALSLADHPHPALKAAGLALVELDHRGCTQSSVEEAQAVTGLMADLLRHQVSVGGVPRDMTINDVLIVTPFNMQVAVLKRSLPPGARVGTVDKFQGQEAPVVIVSMTTSHGEDAPRGTEFLFNRNRINVAISRAQCLAIVVRGRDLLDVGSAGIEDLPRIDLLARFDQQSSV